MKIDPQKQFLRYSENCFNFLTWQQLTSQRRVLLCSITRPQSRFISTYVQHLNLWAEVYKTWGVDEVYFVTHDDRYNFLWIDNLSRSIPVLGDVECSFVKELGRCCNLDHHDPAQLARYWNYQVLIKSGEIEKIYSQPMDNLAVNVLRDTKSLALAREIKNVEHLHLTPYFLRKDGVSMQKILYYRLHPNTDLKNYLLTTVR